MVQKEAAERLWAFVGDAAAFHQAAAAVPGASHRFLPPAQSDQCHGGVGFPDAPGLGGFSERRLPEAEEEMPEVDSAILLEVVKECFRQRKRALRHSLKAYLQQRRLALPARWAKLRAERLKPGEFLELARQLQ
ncbi:unnamed protein product [Effrenium voratum]|nr:unnamed protein product [Effrenium voratum]